MPFDKVRAVFDCNIFWRAFFHRNGIGYECKRLIDTDAIEHFISPEIVKELIDVLTREETLTKFPGYVADDAVEFVKEVIFLSRLTKNVPSIIDLPRDPDDEPYLNLAGFVKADYLVTTDRDLLDLMTGTDVESKEFRQRFRNLKVIKPDEFLRIMSESEDA